MVDNNDNANETDGRLYEITLGGTPPPTRTLNPPTNCNEYTNTGHNNANHYSCAQHNYTNVYTNTGHSNPNVYTGHTNSDVYAKHHRKPCPESWV